VHYLTAHLPPAARPLAALFVSLLVLPTAHAAAPPAKVPAEWHKLIEQLADDDAGVRKAAEKKLAALGEDALPCCAGPARATTTRTCACAPRSPWRPWRGN
jgi:hypothetical protein